MRHYTSFEAGSLRLDGDWALVTLRSYPTQLEDKAHAVVADIYGAIAERTGADGWKIYLETEEAYLAKIRQAPNSFLSDEEKEGLLSTAAVSLQNATD